MRKLWIAAGLLLFAPPAFAATNEYPYSAPSPSFNSGEFFAGAGLGGFTSAFGSVAGVGFAWNLRGGVNMFRYFGAEANYQGTNSGVNTFVQNGFVFQASNITAQQITADVKLQYPFLAGYHIVRPYGFAGVGYGNISADTALAAVNVNSVNAAAFPLGAGISFNITPAFVVDGRFTYNFLTESVGNNWNAVLNLGAAIGGYGY